ncbi:MAG TPA: glycosyltransferase family 9 protein [Bryobacteraceae bacterium]|nr:glycosyltransferase family 9 protein [Bryobacteraceae bacterium]
MPITRLLVVRLGAMGDILHALPAAAALKRSWPGCHLAWAVHPRWRDLLEGGGVADELIEIDRHRLGSVLSAFRRLRAGRFDFAIDFQGLIKSASVCFAAHAPLRYGFERALLREPAAALLYNRRFPATGVHVVDRNLALARHAGAAAGPIEFPLPPGRAEGNLPDGPFVLASPLAGWTSKQWPLESWSEFASLLHGQTPYRLVFNGSPAAAAWARSVPGSILHVSSIAGLIDATRRATAIVGLDSGPLHLAAALSKPGVALFGPTDASRNGPYSDSLRVLRSPGAETSYARLDHIHPSMHALTPSAVFRALIDLLESTR